MLKCYTKEIHNRGITTETFVLDLVLLLLQELRDQIIDCLLHAGESVQAHLVGEGRQARAVELVADFREHLGHSDAILVCMKEGLNVFVKRS